LQLREPKEKKTKTIDITEYITGLYNVPCAF